MLKIDNIEIKNIYIIGTPRSGKTTLAKLLKRKFTDFSLISMDSIRNGFMKSLPHLDMGNKNSISRKEIFPIFISEFIYWNNEILDNYCIVEGALIDLESIKEIKTDKDLVICLGHGNLLIDEIIKNIKKYDTRDDYTFDWSIDKIKEHFEYTFLNDNKNQEICNEKNYIYIDSSENRKEKFDELLKLIKRI